MSPGKVCKSCVLRSIYILYNDYYYQIIIEVAQLRQHKQRLNDLRTQLGLWNSYYITISANEAKTQEEELMQQRTMSHVEQLRT